MPDLLVGSSTINSPLAASITVLIAVNTSLSYMSICIGCMGTENRIESI